MPAPKVRADYEALKQVAQSFARRAEATRQSLQALRRANGILEGGDWVGQGATAFYREMNSAVLPAMIRLVAALECANQVSGQIIQIMQHAEDEAARVLRGSGADGANLDATAGGVTRSKQSSGGTVTAGSASSRGVGSSTSPSGFGGNPLLVRDPHELFTDVNMGHLVGLHFDGENTPELKEVMDTLAAHPEGPSLVQVLRQIADLRRRPYGAIRADYERYLQVRAQAEGIAQAKGIDPPTPLNAWLHDEYMGSTAQLRCGHMVGQAFGLDPVFGALLNPTGGMIGPDNIAIAPRQYGALGYHSEVHDAAGYLFKYHDSGPGYNYLGLDSGDPGNPLTGQVPGLRYWNKTIPPGSDVPKGVRRNHDEELEW